MKRVHKNKVSAFQFFLQLATSLALILGSTAPIKAKLIAGISPPPPIDPEISPLSQDTLNTFNPIKRFQDLNSPAANLINPDGSLNPAGVINRGLNFIFPLSGIILFVMIVWGGFEMLIGAANKKSLDAGKQRVVAALIGFLLLFSSFWLIQIIELITGVAILGS